MKGVRKIKTDIANGNSTIHIVGCHLLLQVIALDKIEKSSMHISQNVLPRVKVFDHESRNKAIDSITSHVGQEVCFAGPDCPLKEVAYPDHHSPNIFGCYTPRAPNTLNVPSSSKGAPRVASKIRPQNMIGPVEFANIMRRKYPKIADDFIGILLKEHNSRLMANMSEIRHTTQMAMLKFLDELAVGLSRRCICCQLSGLITCRLNDNHPAGPVINDDQQNLIAMGTADISDSEEAGSSSGLVHQTHKRVYGGSADNNMADTHLGQNKKQHNNEKGSSVQHGDHADDTCTVAQSTFATNSPIDLMSLVYFNDQLYTSLIMVYEERSRVLFYELTDTPPHTSSLPCKAFAQDPWSSVTRTPNTLSASTQFIALCISNETADNMARPPNAEAVNIAGGHYTEPDHPQRAHQPRMFCPHCAHGAFFKCVESFYSSWPCTSNGWTRAFPKVMTEKFSSEQSGICSIYMARHYDGDNLQSPTTKENLALSRSATLHEVLKLEGNRSDAPHTAMQHMRSSINSL